MSQQSKKQTQTSLSAPFDQYIDEKMRAEITGTSRTTWWRLERQDKMPPVYRIGQMKRWLLSEVLQWRITGINV
ncbi:helix-turn-helix transcriptional regulator [Pseudidiomarina sp.]|uniref:helix-turn-helix transcriptional regulator n=1 Tax=Pseudidiomarina sp. TaxID=2081707 RepID=UPI003A96ACE3